MDFDGQLLPWRILVGLLNEIPQNQRKIKRNLIQELAREPRMILLPLLKPQIIHPYHIYKLVGTWNGL